MKDEIGNIRNKNLKWKSFLVKPLQDILKEIFHGLVNFIIAFAIGTCVGAAVCLYFGIPLMFSLFGGILFMALTFYLMSDGLFF